MQEKKTLFYFLYDSLKQQILSGCRQYGSPLPSLSRLCETYHVGRRTARDVLDALRREGLIHTEERKTAVVIYCQPDSPEENTALRFVLQRKSSLIEVYETMELLIPALLTFSAVHCCTGEPHSLRDLEHYSLFQKYAKKKKPNDDLGIPSVFFHDLLKETGSLLLNDLYASLEVYTRVPLILMKEQFPAYKISSNDYKILSSIPLILESGRQEDVASVFQELYSHATVLVRLYLDSLSSRFPDIPDEPEAVYTWQAQMGRDHFYMQLARALIDKIGTGACPPGTRLPSEAALSKSCRVSLSTVRKALSTLNDLGFARTENGKGTVICLQDDETAFQCIKNPSYRRDTLLYLSAAQFMTIAVRPAARLAFPRLNREVQAQLGREISLPGSNPLACIFRCIMDNLTLRPLKSILSETDQLLLWGYYFAFFEKGTESSTPLHQLAAEAFHLLQQNDAEGFSRQLSLCYCHILQFVRDFMISGGLTEAKKIMVPYPEEG